MVGFIVYLEDDGLPGFQRSGIDDADDSFRGSYDDFILLAEWVRFGRFGRGVGVVARAWFQWGLVFGYGRGIRFGNMAVVGDAGGTR